MSTTHQGVIAPNPEVIRPRTAIEFLRSADESGSRKSWRKLHAFRLRLLLLTVFCFCAVLNVGKSWKLIRTDADTTYPESAIVQTARWAGHTHHIYPAFEAPPFTPAPYGPLFYLGLAAAGKIIGDTDYKIRVSLRLIVFLCYLGTAWAAYLLSRRGKALRQNAILAAAAVLGTPFALNWNISARPDFPALLLSLMAIWLISKPGGTYRTFALSGAFAAAAVLTKQPYVAALLAIAISLLFRRRYKQLAQFFAGALVAGASVIGYLLYCGEPVLREMLVIGRSPLNPQSGLFYLTFLFVGPGILVVALGCTGLLSRRVSECWPAELMKCYFLCALPVALLTLLQIGSNNNYVLELWVILSIEMACAIPEAELAWRTLESPLKTGSIVVLLFLTMQAVREIRHSPPICEFNFDRLGSLRILSTDPSLTVHGKRPELLDPFLSTLLEKAKVLSDSGVYEQIQRQEYDLVITEQDKAGGIYRYHGQPLFSNAMVEVLAKHYRPFCRTSNMVVMLPKRREPFSLEDASYTLGEQCTKISPEDTPRAAFLPGGPNSSQELSDSDAFR